MRRLAAPKPGSLVLTLFVIAVPIFYFAVVTPHLAIVTATVVGAILAHVALALVRSSRLAAPSMSVVPGGLDRTFGSRRRQIVVPAELPPPPGVLEGRDREVERACEYLSQPNAGRAPRLIVVHGEPGVGKTAFAIKVAHLVADSYPDGQLLVRFHHGQSDPAIDPLAMLFYALKGPNDREPEDREAWYRDRTRDKQVLVILDNIDNERQIRSLLPAGRRCVAIVTSKTPLPALQPQHSVGLGPLDEVATTQLMNMLVGGDRVKAETDSASRIVAATHGYPVAIHMAGTALAVRRNWTLEVAVRRMAEAAAARRTAGQQDPAAAPFAGVLDLAYALLTEQERAALTALGLLDKYRVEPWMLAALLNGAFPENPAIPQTSAGRLLDRLARARFAERSVEDRSGVLTFRIPAYVRAYARTCVDALLTTDRQTEALREVRAQERRRAERSTEDFLRSTVYRYLDEGKLDDALTTARESLALTRERLLIPPSNGDAEAVAEEGLTLAALGEVYAELGWIDDGLTCAERARDRGRASPHTLARALRVAGSLHQRYHQTTAAMDNLVKSLRNARQVNDELEQIRILRELASTLALTERPQLGLQHAEDAHRMCLRAGSQGMRHLPGVLLAQAKVLQAGKDFATASSVLSEAEKLTVEPDSGQQLWRSWIRLQHALVSLDTHDYDRSRQLSLAALDGFATLRHRYGSAHARLTLGRAYLRESKFEKAIPVLEESHSTFRRCGDRWIEADSAVALADAYRSVDRGREAIDLVSAAEQAFSKLSDGLSLKQASRLLWIVESSLKPEPLRIWPLPKERPTETTQRPLLPAPTRAVNWPVS